jgi:hypothetical protein
MPLLQTLIASLIKSPKPCWPDAPPLALVHVGGREGVAFGELVTTVIPGRNGEPTVVLPLLSGRF